MAHLWIRDADAVWAALPLPGDRAVRLDAIPGPGFPGIGGGDATPGPEVAPVTVGGRRGWALFAAPARGLDVNGLPLRAGIRVLADRDEVGLGGGGPRFFFSTERLALIQPLADLGRAIKCARCGDPLEPGSPAVSCPQCDRWHHERPGQPCWTSIPQCATCPQATDLDLGFRWTPEEL